MSRPNGLRSGVMGRLKTLAAACAMFMATSSGWTEPPRDKEVQPNADVVFHWLRDTFSATPQVIVLPVAIRASSDKAFFSRSEVESAENGLEPGDALLIDKTLQDVDKMRTQEEQMVRIASQVGSGSSAQLPLGRRELFFRNPRVDLSDNDLIGQVANEQKAIYFDQVALLVDNRLYKESSDIFNRSSLPPGMGAFVDHQLFRLTQQLSATNRGKMAGCHLTFSHSPSQAVVWMQTMTDSHSVQCHYIITMSPVLVRAIFTDTVKGQLGEWLAMKSLHPQRQEDMTQSLLERFSNRLFFILGHEIGHIVSDAFGLTADLPHEECCDEIAQLLASRVGNGDVGSFRELLGAAVKQGAGSLWAVETMADGRDVLNRLKRLEALQSGGPRACNIVP